MFGNKLHNITNLNIIFGTADHKLEQHLEIATVAGKLDEGIIFKQLRIKVWFIYLKKIHENFKFDNNFQKGCVEQNTDYHGSNIYNDGDKTANTEEKCQKACQQHSACNWWSLNLSSQDNYGCWLKSKKNFDERETKIGRSFGPKFCGKLSSKCQNYLLIYINKRFKVTLFCKFIIFFLQKSILIVQ